MEPNSIKLEPSTAPYNSEIVIDTSIVRSNKGSETVNLLSDGVVRLFEPGLVEVKQQLNELVTKQEVLIEQLHNENLKLSWSQNSNELQGMFDMIKQYQHKLLHIKKDMRTLHDRSVKLKKRATRLEQHVEKEINIKNLQVKREEDLIPKSDSNNVSDGSLH